MIEHVEECAVVNKPSINATLVLLSHVSHILHCNNTVLFHVEIYIEVIEHKKHESKSRTHELI